ncbi:MAG: WD40 repeat domain-containing protein [Gemmataceae bacterium]|nr:WD40 repeat domain-containing protein [Gemmataceae bacterium]
MRNIGQQRNIIVALAYFSWAVACAFCINLELPSARTQQRAQPAVKELATLANHKDQVYLLSFSSNGKLLASASGDRSIRIWDVAARKELTILEVAVGPANRDIQIVRAREALEDLCECSLSCETLYGNPTLRSDGANTDGVIDASACSPSRRRPLVVLAATRVAEGKDLAWSITFSPDGKLLASGTRDGMVKLWDVAKGKQLASFKGHRLGVISIGWSADGKTMATAGTEGIVKQWDIPTMKGRGQFGKDAEGEHLRSMAVLSDGQRFVTAHAIYPVGELFGSCEIRLWDSKKAMVMRTMRGHRHIPSNMAISADNCVLASASEDKTIILWSVSDGKKLFTLKGHADTPHGLAFTSDGKMLASGSRRLVDEEREVGVVKLWEVGTGKERATFEGHEGLIFSLVFSPDDKLLATGSADGKIKLWDVVPGR